MMALKPVYSYVPTVVALCDEEDVIGGDFYVMERLHGIILRRDLPPELGFTSMKTAKLCIAFIDKLIALHQADSHDLQWIGKGEGYIQRQVERWSDRFRQSRTEDVGDCEQIMTWLNDTAST
jgi:aminoglycoside phosphotransferase (APT) family kinase protein